MARGDSLARQLQLFMLLDGQRALSVDVAAERLGCTRRTVYRDFEVLQRVGMPLFQEQQGRRARWRLEETYRRRLTVTLAVPEVLGLLVGAQLMRGLDGSTFQRAAERAIDKLRGALSAEVIARLEAVLARFSVASGPRHTYSERRDTLDELVEAVERCETVRVEYRKPEAERAERYTVDPHFMHVDRGGIYAIGWVHERNATRTFLLDRVLQVERGGQRFERRAAIDVRSFAQGEFGVWEGAVRRIAVRVRGAAARRVAETVLHPTQVNQWRSDGALDVTMKLPLSPALRTWIRSFGADLTVLSPRELAS